jgi:hypothetical protein
MLLQQSLLISARRKLIAVEKLGCDGQYAIY